MVAPAAPASLESRRRSAAVTPLRLARTAPILVALAALAVSAASAQDAGPSVNGYVTLGNGYWSHGLSQNDGASVQLGVDYQHQSGLFTGAWAANVEFPVEYSYGQPREVVAEVYAGLHRRRVHYKSFEEGSFQGNR